MVDNCEEPKWYAYVLGIAHNMLRGANHYNIDVHEMVNVAYVDTLCRLKEDTPMLVVGKAASRSMASWLRGNIRNNHKYRSRGVPDYYAISLHNDDGLMSDREAAKNTVSYDDCEELACVLRKLQNGRKADIVLLCLHGYTYKQVGNVFDLSESRVCQIVQMARDEYALTVAG